MTSASARSGYTSPDPRTALARDAVRRESVYRPPHELDLMGTVGTHRRGIGDPTMRVVGNVIWRATLTPAGAATLALRARGAEVLAAAWGPGAGEALDQVPELCGADDDPSAFDPGANALVGEAHRRNPGLRIGATGIIADAVVSSILEQKVTGKQAFGAWRWLVSRAGIAAPGPAPHGMFAAPSLAVWGRIPSWSWHRAGVEPPQSRTVVALAARGVALTESLMAAPTNAERDDILCAQRGVGPWTSAEVRIRAFGDVDAVSVGDFHLAHHVGFALTGTRTDDAGMLELLAPWAGQRQRVIRLLMRSGATEPRRGPRLHPEDHRLR